ncbi:hypothetical protein, partial [Vibrio kanaloae]|uniref:hypothetical protein n=1 Tax=Vibrio kanaloae TaxID=170673 RepID=UPI0019CF7F8B
VYLFYYYYFEVSIFCCLFLLLFVNTLKVPLVAPTLPSAALKVPFSAPLVPVDPERSETSAKHAVVL